MINCCCRQLTIVNAGRRYLRTNNLAGKVRLDHMIVHFCHVIMSLSRDHICRLSVDMQNFVAPQYSGQQLPG